MSAFGGILALTAVRQLSQAQPVEVIAEGESFFNPANALSVVQDILTAHPDLHAIVGSDQSMQGSDQALSAAGITFLAMCALFALLVVPSGAPLRDPAAVADEFEPGEVPAGRSAFQGSRGTPESFSDDPLATTWNRPSSSTSTRSSSAG